MPSDYPDAFPGACGSSSSTQTRTPAIEGSIRIDAAVRYLWKNHAKPPNNKSMEPDLENKTVGILYRLVASSGVLDGSRRARLGSKSGEVKALNKPTKPKKTVRFNVPEASTSSKDSKSNKVGDQDKVKGTMRQPTGWLMAETSGKIYDRSDSLLLPWPAGTRHHRTAPAWHAALAYIYTIVREHSWPGDWYSAAPINVDYIPFPLGPNYQEVLEWKEILRGLGLVYALHEVSVWDSTFRRGLRVMVGSRSRRKIRRKIHVMNPDPVGIPARPPTLWQGPILQRVRQSVALAKEEIDTSLGREIEDLVADLGGVPTFEAIAQRVWLTSRDGFKLWNALNELGGHVDDLHGNAHKILERLGKVRTALTLINEVQRIRKMYRVPEGSYSIPQEVLDITYHGLTRIEGAVGNFITVCQGHKDELSRLKDSTPREVIDSSSMIDQGLYNGLRASDTVTSFDDFDRNPEDLFLQAAYDEDRAIDQVKRETRAWATRRCEDIGRLCDILEDYYDSGRDAFSNLGMVRESDMAAKEEVLTVAGSNRAPVYWGRDGGDDGPKD